MRLLGVMLAVSLMALSACSDDDGTSSAEEQTEATSAASPASAGEGLREAVQAYSDAFLTGDGETAYGVLSARCQERLGKADFVAVVDQASEQYGKALPFTDYDADVQGTMARVSYAYDVASLSQDSEPWVQESGEWHQDDC